jgi:hypothetical protein
MQTENNLVQLTIEFPPHAEWRDVPEWEDLYQISDLGKLRAKKSRIRGHYKAGDILNSRFSSDGYETVALCRGQTRKTAFVHHLVMFAFVGARPEGMDINHIDGVKANNCLSNLEYITHKENIYHAISIGVSFGVRGEENYGVKLSEQKVRDIRRRCAAGERYCDLGKEYGVLGGTIRAVYLRKIWKWLD